MTVAIRPSFLLLASLVLTLFTARAQGPISGFMPPRGELTLAPAYARESFDTYFDADGPRAATLQTTTYSLFAEYGLNEQSAILLTAPYVRSSAGNRGWQDGSVWLKYRNQRTEHEAGYNNWITAVGVGFPLSRYPIADSFAIGQRATTFHGRLLWQYDFTSGFFLHAQSGIDFQISPTARAVWPLLLRAGFGARYYYVEGWIERVRSLNSTSGPNLAAGAGSSWWRSGATLYLPLHARAGLFGNVAYILAGEHIGQLLRWGVGGVVRL